MPESEFSRNQAEFVAPEEGSPAYKPEQVENQELARDMAIAEDPFREELVALEAKLEKSRDRGERKDLRTAIDTKERQAEYAGGQLEIEAGWQDIFHRHQERAFERRLDTLLREQRTGRYADHSPKGFTELPEDERIRLDYISSIGKYVIPAERELLDSPAETISFIPPREKELQQWLDFKEGKRKTRPDSRAESDRRERGELWNSGNTDREIQERAYWLKRAKQIQQEHEKE